MPNYPEVRRRQTRKRLSNDAVALDQLFRYGLTREINSFQMKATLVTATALSVHAVCPSATHRSARSPGRGAAEQEHERTPASKSRATSSQGF